MFFSSVLRVAQKKSTKKTLFQKGGTFPMDSPICHRNEMKRKILEHINRTDIYIKIQNLDQTDHDYVEYRLNEIKQQLMTKLNDLFDRKFISEYQFQQMQIDPTRLRLDFLSFQPDIRHVC